MTDSLNEMLKFSMAVSLACSTVYDPNQLTTNYINGVATEAVCICKTFGYAEDGDMATLLHAIHEYGHTSPRWVLDVAFDLANANDEEFETYNTYRMKYNEHMRDYIITSPIIRIALNAAGLARDPDTGELNLSALLHTETNLRELKDGEEVAVFHITSLQELELLFKNVEEGKLKKIDEDMYYYEY